MGAKWASHGEPEFVSKIKYFSCLSIEKISLVRVVLSHFLLKKKKFAEIIIPFSGYIICTY